VLRGIRFSGALPVPGFRTPVFSYEYSKQGLVAVILRVVSAHVACDCAVYVAAGLERMLLYLIQQLLYIRKSLLGGFPVVDDGIGPLGDISDSVAGLILRILGEHVLRREQAGAYELPFLVYQVIGLEELPDPGNARLQPVIPQQADKGVLVLSETDGGALVFQDPCFRERQKQRLVLGHLAGLLHALDLQVDKAFQPRIRLYPALKELAVVFEERPVLRAPLDVQLALDVLQRQSELLQVYDQAEPFELVPAVVSVACGIGYYRRQKQAYFFIEPDRLDRNLE